MAVLTPSPKMQFESAAGVPLSGGKLYTYTAGTTTPLATFTDATGATPNANPVILDSRGEAAIWLGAASYKFKLTDANDVEIWTVDYISAPTSGVSPILSGNVTIDSDTPGPALKITQTGTGPVMRVQDSADPDSTPFIIDSAGQVGVGTATPAAPLDVTGAARLGSLTLTSSPLAVGSGGTGRSSLTANSLLLGDGTNAVQLIAPGTANNVLVSNGSTWTSAAVPDQFPSQAGNAGTALITNGTAISWGSSTVRSTPQAVSTGTAVDFTGIPSWARRITIVLDEISTTGTSGLRIQVGSGSVATSGYISSASDLGNGSAIVATSSTTGFDFRVFNASYTSSGLLVLAALGTSNRYVLSGVIKQTTTNTQTIAGIVTLGGALDRVRITVVTTGSDGFDGSGNATVLWE